MPLSPSANLILYVPFTDEYTVSDKRIRKLDINTFFEECFVEPHLDKDLEKLLRMPETEISDPEYPLKKEDFVRKYEEDAVQRDAFLEWFKGHGKGIYLLRGDAGTGKTTYVHYLKWKFADVNWKIIDLQRANKKITVLGHRIKFSNFFSLHGKVISAVVNKVISAIFLTQNDISPDVYKEISSNIQLLLCMYNKYIHHMGPLDEYDLLYRTLGDLPAPVDGEELGYCKHCAKLVTEYFMKMCVMNSDVEDALECAIVHYLIVLRCLRGSKKTVIVFDNLERFIGVHEIFSNELIDFVANLRTIVDTYKDQYFDSLGNRNRFAENCQLIVSMRNTSARNFTPLQNADFFESSIDLSEWFSMGEILQRKLTWFEKEKIEVENTIETTFTIIRS